jgi:hypothetical protein
MWGNILTHIGMHHTYNKSLGLPRLFLVFESYTDTSSN